MSSSRGSGFQDPLKYRKPKFKHIMLLTEKVDYFLILDFEANNNKDGTLYVKEIIEFPVLKVNAKTLKTESKFHTYVQPIAYPKIDPFITGFCGITQDMVEGKPHLPDALVQFHEWMKKEGLLERGVKFCFVTFTDCDLQYILPVNCDYLKLPYPDYLKHWIDIKRYFEDITRSRPAGSMQKVLRYLGLEQDGRHHSGIDDSRNTAKILRALARMSKPLQDGVVEPQMLVRK